MFKAKTLGLKLVFSLVFLFSAALLYASQYNMIKPEELKIGLQVVKRLYSLISNPMKTL